MQNQYEILIENLCIEAIIGILPNERKNPQKVLVNASVKYKKKDFGYLDYVKIIEHIAKCLQTQKYDLLENALDDIISSLKNYYPNITKIDLNLKKPDIFGHYKTNENVASANTQKTKNATKNAKSSVDYKDCVLGVRKVHRF